MNQAEGQTERPEPAAPSPEAPFLFLCEDSEDDEFWFKKTSQKAGLSVPIRVAPTVREAIEFLRSCCESGQTMPSLMVMDFRLSDGKCLEVLDYVRTQPKLQETPIITYSGGLNKEDLQSTQQYGVVASLEKPLKAEHVEHFRPYFR
jgi:CheY-like chemotaxis protein